VAVCPSSVASLQTNNTTTFTADIVGTSETAVTWEVNGIAGGNSTYGTISSSGVYTAPSSVPSPATVTVQAVSMADPTASAATPLTVTAPPKSGGGSMDPLTLLVEAFVLCGLAVGRRRR
jgi:hypothetical protein